MVCKEGFEGKLIKKNFRIRLEFILSLGTPRMPSAWESLSKICWLSFFQWCFPNTNFTLLHLFCGSSSPPLSKMETCRYALSRRNIDSCSEALIQNYWQMWAETMPGQKTMGTKLLWKTRVQKYNSFLIESLLHF